MRTKYLLLSALIIGFFACQKDPDDDLLGSSACTLEKIIFYDSSGAPDDTAILTYNGNDVSQVELGPLTVKLDYTNGKVSKRNILAAGTTTVIYYDQFSYNADGKISKVESYFNGLGTPLMYYSYDYTYNGGKLTTILEKQDTSSTGGMPLVPSYEYTFSYTGNNITQLVEKDLFTNTISDTYTYTYDNKPNYFSKIPNLFYYETIFLDLFTPNLPIGLSENNVLGYTDSFGTTTLSHTEENGNLKTLSVDGMKVEMYQYKCQ